MPAIDASPRAMTVHHAERGSATIFVIGFALVLFAGAGLAIDGGRAINLRDKVTDVAEQAARAGADEIDQAQLRDAGRVVLDQAKAKATADDFVTRAGYSSSTTIDADAVRVVVSSRTDTALLGIVFITHIPVSGIAVARPRTGINGVIP